MIRKIAARVNQADGLGKFLAFLAIGSFFATVEEFLTVVVLRHDLGSYLFTLLVLFPVFLTLVYFSSRLIGQFFANERTRELVHYWAYGLIGLLIEWFLIGLSPWSNPQANPLLMLLFQLGMFSFWATVGFAPRLFANPVQASRRARKSILRFYIPFFIFTYAASLLAPEGLRFAVVVGLVVFGYGFLNTFYMRYFLQRYDTNLQEV